MKQEHLYPYLPCIFLKWRIWNKTSCIFIVLRSFFTTSRYYKGCFFPAYSHMCVTSGIHTRPRPCTMLIHILIFAHANLRIWWNIILYFSHPENMHVTLKRHPEIPIIKNCRIQEHFSIHYYGSANHFYVLSYPTYLIIYLPKWRSLATLSLTRFVFPTMYTHGN